MADGSHLEKWIGKGIDYSKLWRDFNHSDGGAYINNFLSSNPDLLKIEFASPSVNQPLFQVEAIYKSIKGLYHDFKEFCLTQSEYKTSLPIFLYSIERGSADWAWMLDPNMIFNIVNLLVSGFSLYGSSKMANDISDIKKEMTISSEKLNAFLKQSNCKIIFENLDKFKPTKITIKKKIYSGYKPSLTEEDIIIIEFNNRKIIKK